jgi:hypothetical protein
MSSASIRISTSSPTPKLELSEFPEFGAPERTLRGKADARAERTQLKVV